MSSRFTGVIFAMSVLLFVSLTIMFACCRYNRLPETATASPEEKTPPAGKEPVLISRTDFLLEEYPKTVKKYPLNAFSKGTANSKVIALTFDDGPDGELTPRILDVLEKKKVKATFFVCGKNVQAYPDVFQRIVKEGHEVGNHSWDHPDFCSLSSQEIDWQVRRTAEEINRQTGYVTNILRLPYGSINPLVGCQLADLKYFIIHWSIDTFDYLGPSKETIIKRVTDAASGGDIVLQHCVPGNDKLRNSVEALPVIIDVMQERGFRFVTIREMLEIPVPSERLS